MPNKRNRNTSFDENLSFNSSKKKALNNTTTFSTLLNDNCDFSDISLISSEMEMFKVNLLKPDFLNSTMSDSPEKNDDPASEIDKFSEELKGKKEVSNNDLATGISMLISMNKSTNNRLESLDNKLTAVNVQANINTKNIDLIHRNTLVQADLIFKNIESVCYFKQDKIDKEIFLSGFPAVPDERIIIKELCKLYKVQQNTIKHHRTVTIKNKDGTTKSAYMVIKFATKEDQIQFLQNKNVTGQPTLAKLTNQEVNENNKRIIKISRRLSVENRQIIQKLREYQTANKIVKIRFKNCFYEVLAKQDGKFQPIPSIPHLNMIMGSSQNA